MLTILSKREDGVESIVYTGKISKQLQLDVDKYNAQYPPVDVRTFSKAHDRFLIIDNDVYLIGASIKDLGKKWFGFTLMENTDADDLIGRIKWLPVKPDLIGHQKTGTQSKDQVPLMVNNTPLEVILGDNGQSDRSRDWGCLTDRRCHCCWRTGCCC